MDPRPLQRPALRGLSRSLAAVLLVALAALTLSGCGGDDPKPPTPAVTVHMGEFFYRPAEVTLPRNSSVSVVNDGTVVHTWIVKGAGVGTAGVAPGQSILVNLRGIAPGTYTVYCDQPGHTQNGQSGTLTITP